MLSYFSRYKTLPPFFEEKPNENVGIIVVIPCYDDDFVFQTLESLNVAEKLNCEVEVIVVVNSAENTDINIVNKNRDVFDSLRQNPSFRPTGEIPCKQAAPAPLSCGEGLGERLEPCKQNPISPCGRNDSGEWRNDINILPILLENVPKKIAGVGNARKTGMDEAVRRFAAINKNNGIIVSLDSDCLVAKNYFIEIEKYFLNNSKSDCCTINFQHNFDKNLYLEQEIYACQLYETYLRYFQLSLAATGFPYCFHTIGSCFAVKALFYTKLGGMARLQAGEDFYFLHKAAQATKVGIIDEKIVFPAPRLSDRVPFGTGKAIQKIIENKQYKVYNFELFLILKRFFDTFEQIFETKTIDLKMIPKEIINFLTEKKLLEIFNETIANTKHKEQFIKRLYSKFDAFFVIRFLNFFNNSEKFPPNELFEEVKKMVEHYNNGRVLKVPLNTNFTKTTN